MGDGHEVSLLSVARGAAFLAVSQVEPHDGTPRSWTADFEKSGLGEHALGSCVARRRTNRRVRRSGRQRGRWLRWTQDCRSQFAGAAGRRVPRRGSQRRVPAAAACTAGTGIETRRRACRRSSAGLPSSPRWPVRRRPRVRLSSRALFCRSSAGPGGGRAGAERQCSLPRQRQGRIAERRGCLPRQRAGRRECRCCLPGKVDRGVIARRRCRQKPE